MTRDKSPTHESLSQQSLQEETNAMPSHLALSSSNSLIDRPTAIHRETATPDSCALTSTRTRSLLHRSRRSVPSFLPSLQHLTAPAPAPSNLDSATVDAILPLTPVDPNVTERPRQHPSCALRPDVKSTMPSSVAYSETRTLASDHGRSLNGSYRLGAENKGPDMDEGRPKNEDIFLNIARTDSGRRDSLGRSDFRRVSLPLPVAMPLDRWAPTRNPRGLQS